MATPLQTFVQLQQGLADATKQTATAQQRVDFFEKSITSVIFSRFQVWMAAVGENSPVKPDGTVGFHFQGQVRGKFNEHSPLQGADFVDLRAEGDCYIFSYRTPADDGFRYYFDHAEVRFPCRYLDGATEAECLDALFADARKARLPG